MVWSGPDPYSLVGTTIILNDDCRHRNSKRRKQLWISAFEGDTYNSCVYNIKRLNTRNTVRANRWNRCGHILYKNRNVNITVSRPHKTRTFESQWSYYQNMIVVIVNQQHCEHTHITYGPNMSKEIQFGHQFSVGLTFRGSSLVNPHVFSTKPCF